MEAEEFKILVIRGEDDQKSMETVNITSELLQKLTDGDSSQESYHVEKVHCRLCDENTRPDDSNKLYDNKHLSQTVLGAKLLHLLQTSMSQVNLSIYCCSSCTTKINVCFNLLLNVRVADILVRQTYSNESDTAEAGNFKCGDCGQDIVGSSDFLSHYESHIIGEAIQNEEQKTIKQEIEVKYRRQSLDEVDEDAQSNSSDNSLDNLMKIVKLELNKSDDESDTDLPPPNATADGKYHCTKCTNIYEYKFLYLRHKCGTPDEFNLMQSCVFCKTVFPMPEIQKHSSRCKKAFYSNKKFLCNICGKLFNSKQWLRHRFMHCKTNGQWMCKVCQKVFAERNLLIIHNRIHVNASERGLKGPTILKGKNKFENKALILSDSHCWMCGLKMESIELLQQHLKEEHNTLSVGQESRFECSHCDKKFPDMFTLKAHLKLIHEVKDEEIAKYKSCPVYRSINCNVCGSIFNSENRMRIHLRDDHGLKNFEMEILKKSCEKCGKKFASKQNLIHHINTAHLHFKPMSCEMCGEKFAKHSSLIYHKLRHSGEKPFECELCHRTYRQRNDVVRHLARHVRDDQISFEEASALNNSPSPLVVKRRIFLKDSQINYNTVARKRRGAGRGRVISRQHREAADDLLLVEEMSTSPVYEEIVMEPGDFLTPVYDPAKNTLFLT